MTIYFTEAVGRLRQEDSLRPGVQSQPGQHGEESIICETATSIYRAGAGILLTYFAKELAKFMDQGRIG